MGVPAFFRWLSDKYPKIMNKAIEEVSDNGEIDASQRNPK